MEIKINPDKIGELREKEGKVTEAYLDDEGKTTKLEYEEDGVKIVRYYEYPKKGVVIEKVSIDGKPSFITIEDEEGKRCEVDYDRKTIQTDIYKGKDKIKLTNGEMETDVYDSIETNYDRESYDEKYAIEASWDSEYKTDKHNNMELPVDFEFVPYDLLLKGRHPDAKFYERRIAEDIGKDGKIFKKTYALRKKTEPDGKERYFRKNPNGPTKEVESAKGFFEKYASFGPGKAQMHALIASRQPSKIKELLSKFLDIFRGKENKNQER